jgi:hypothetical protein
MLGMAKGESNIRGRNKVEHNLLIFFPNISIMGDGGRGIYQNTFCMFKNA